MGKNHIGQEKQRVVKWVALLGIVFMMSLFMTGYKCMASGNTYRVQVAKGYLALRTDKSFN